MNQRNPSATLHLMTLVAATGGFLFGYDTAVINGANHYLTNYFGLNPTQEGIAGASAILGCIPGALLGGFLSDRSGRKKVLFLSALLFGISGVWSALPWTFDQFLVARFIGGLGIGISSMVCPVYIAECAPADRRGRLGTLFQLGIVIGVFLTLFINAYIQGLGDSAWNTELGWRLMLGVEAIPALIFVVLIALSPESPRWLIQKNRVDEARQILTRFTLPARIEEEIQAVSSVVAAESDGLGMLFRRRFRRPLVIAVGIMAISQFSGINAIMYYSTKIFTSAGVGVHDAFTATLFVGFVNLLFTFVAIAFVDRLGRRPLLLCGLAAQVLALSAVAWLLGTHHHGLLLLLAVFVFVAAFAMALGPISWLLCSEIFPAGIRGRAMSMAAFTTWVSCYIVAQTFPMLNDSPTFGPAKTFLIYAAVSLIGLIFAILAIPETKGRTLEQIETSWQT